MGLCVGDWTKLNCGDVIREREGRHFFRVNAIINGAIIVAQNLETKQDQDFDLNDLFAGDLIKVKKVLRPGEELP